MYKRKRFCVFFIVAGLVFLAVLACSPPLDEAVRNAEEDVQRQTVQEQPLLYDNGENFLWVNTDSWAKAMVLLQKWTGEHPAKKIVTISSDSAGSGGTQSGWLVYYEDR